jgi:hypothetical protein
MFTAAMAEPRKKKTDEVIPQVAEIFHAAEQILSYQRYLLILDAVSLNSSWENLSFGFLKLTSSIESIGIRCMCA